ncbi:hypothetical protein G9Z98_003903 [Salmonella enterica]|nr:hypothetical protein [Salmonella enterica]
MYLSHSAQSADDVDQMLTTGDRRPATGGQCAEGQLRAATAIAALTPFLPALPDSRGQQRLCCPKT